MPDKVSCVTVTRTVTLKVRPDANAGKRDALLATVQGWDRAVAFYTDFFLGHPNIFSEKKTYVVERGKHAGEDRQRPLTNQEILTWAERHTVATEAHPNPARDFGQACPQAPTVLRRAAINHAAGAVRSHLSNLARWEAADPKRRGKAPAPPRPHPHLVAYEGLSSLRLEDYREGYLRLRLLDGKRWQWHNVPVQAPPTPRNCSPSRKKRKNGSPKSVRPRTDAWRRRAECSARMRSGRRCGPPSARGWPSLPC